MSVPLFFWTAMSYIIKVQDLGYYAENQPTYDYCWTDDFKKARMYKTVKGMDDILERFISRYDEDKIEVHKVKIEITKEDFVVKPFEVDYDEVIEDDGKQYKVTLTCKRTGKSFVSEHERYKARARKKALRQMKYDQFGLEYSAGL